MIQEMLPSIYRVAIPLPKSPLGNLNCYMIKDSDKTLILDTGFNSSSCLQGLEQGLEELEVDPAHSEVVITHMHSDHSGLVSLLEERGATICCHPRDAGFINSTGQWEDILEFGYRCGVPQEKLHQARDSHPGYRYRPERPVELSPLHDGDIIHTGTYSFTCLHTPGHTEGHICLYEPGQGLLICGDLILRGITPNISQWSDEGNPLGEYLQSLERIRELDPGLTLPGHREPFRDPADRIGELKEHHRRRLEEILSLLPEEGLTAYEVASRMRWDLDTANWEDFPLAQKWFATGEAMAHLSYLKQQGLVTRELVSGRHIFCKAAGESREGED